MQNKNEYGLILNKAKITKTNKQPIKTFVANTNNRNDSEDDEEISPTDYKALINKSISRQQNYNTKIIAEEISKNIIEDPNIYEYDSLYDNYTSKNQNRSKTNPISNNYNDSVDNSKPKYINAILAATEKRKIEQSIIKEKVERKRREREEGQYGDKPKYVTKSYEQALTLNKKTEIETANREQNNTVNSDFGMMGFYSNLLTKNSAMGAQSKEEKEEAEILMAYQTKKKAYENFLRKDDDENSQKNIRVKGNDTNISKQNFDEELIVNEIKKLKNTKEETNTQNKPDSNEISEKNNVDELKLRYLERKRLREEKKD